MKSFWCAVPHRLNFFRAPSTCLLGVDGQRPVDFHPVAVAQDRLGFDQLAEDAQFVLRSIYFGEHPADPGKFRSLPGCRAGGYVQLPHNLLMRQRIDDYDLNLSVHVYP